MTYEILPHTADVGIAASGATLEELFSEAVRGTAAVILDTEPPPPTGAAPISASGEDPAALLAAFLEECLFLWESEGRLAVGADLRVEAGRCAGKALVCEGVEAGGPAIKAVTYHQLRVEKVGDRWEATVYFDV
jgi:SHS2 domain-containing protein